MNAVRELPSTYEPRGTLDLSKDNQTTSRRLGILGLLLLLPTGWLVLRYLAAVRPDVNPFDLQWSVLGVLLRLAAFAALFVGWVLIHEAIHALVFWALTHERPRFGFRGIYAFTAVPELYVPRAQYLAVCVAPLVVITSVGLGLIVVAPAWLVPGLALMVVLNVAGCIGDVASVTWLATKPSGSLIHDDGDRITLYQPT